MPFNYNVMICMLHLVTQPPIGTSCPSLYECVTANKDTCPTTAVFSVTLRVLLRPKSLGTSYYYYMTFFLQTCEFVIFCVLGQPDRFLSSTKDLYRLILGC